MKKKPLTTKVINQKPDKRLKVVSNQRLHREWLTKQINKELKEKENQMKSIEDHIEKDKQILDDPQANPAARRHAKEELHDLEEYAEHHKDEIAAGDHHDPKDYLPLTSSHQSERFEQC